MEFFETSGTWSVALGKTLVHSLWIGLLLLSLLKIILHSIPGHLSTTRYRIATFSLFIFPATVITLFFLLYLPDQAQTGGLPSPLRGQGLGSIIQDLPSITASMHTAALFTVLSYIYLAGILIMLIRTMLSFMQVRNTKRGGIPVTGKWLDRFMQIKERTGIGRKVVLLRSDRICVPTMSGILKPAIIVPAGMFTQLSHDQVETILMHELYHLRRLDFLVNLLQLLVEALFFYNPALLSISRIIRTEREHCCDDMVIRSFADPLVYARALFRLAEQNKGFSLLVPGAVGTNHHQLFNRIKRILNQTNMKTNIREKLFSFAMMALGLIILLTVSGFSSGLSISKHTDSRNEGVLPEAIPTHDPVSQPSLRQDTIPGQQSEKSKEDKETLESAELEALMNEVEGARKEAMAEIDWDKIKIEVEAARNEAMKEINWDEIRNEMEESLKDFKEIDWDKIRGDIEKSMEEINWDEIKVEMENVRIQLDSMLHDFHLEFDPAHDPEKGQSVI